MLESIVWLKHWFGMADVKTKLKWDFSYHWTETKSQKIDQRWGDSCTHIVIVMVEFSTGMKRIDTRWNNLRKRCGDSGIPVSTLYNMLLIGSVKRYQEANFQDHSRCRCRPRIVWHVSVAVHLRRSPFLVIMRCQLVVSVIPRLAYSYGIKVLSSFLVTWRKNWARNEECACELFQKRIKEP